MMKKTTLSLMMTLSLLGVEPAFASNAVLAAPAATTSSLGGFTALWTGNRLQIKSGSRVIWESVAAESFLRAGTRQLDAHELRGSFTTTENIVTQCTDQTITSFTQSTTEIVFKGRLSGNAACATGYVLTFTQPLTGHLKFRVTFDNPAVNYSELAYSSSADERFHGFGEQFSVLNMKGKTVPVLSQEAGLFSSTIKPDT